MFGVGLRVYAFAVANGFIALVAAVDATPSFIDSIVTAPTVVWINTRVGATRSAFCALKIGS